MPFKPAAAANAAAAQRFQFLDWARAAGMILVVIYHATLEASGDPMKWRGIWWDPTGFSPAVSIMNMVLQWLQVPSMFFVISGYLLHRSLARHEHQGMSTMLLRRAARLYVPYLIMLVYFVAIWPWTRLEPTTDNVQDFLLHALLLFNFRPDTLWTINASFWYLAVELQLCLVFPLLLLSARRFGWNRTLLATLVIELGTRILASFLAAQSIAGDLTEEWPMRVPPAFLFTWAIGAWIAAKGRSGELKRPSLPLLFALPVVALVATVVWPLTGIAPLLAALCYATGLAWLVTRKPKVAVSAAAPVATAPPWSTRLVGLLGSVSLGVYLMNQPVVIDIEWRLALWIEEPFLRTMATSLLTMVLLVPCAYVMSRFIERPLNRLADALITRAQTRRQPGANANVPLPP